MYVDESGDLGFGKKGSSRYFVISALLIDDCKEPERLVKNMRRNKFKKELRKSNELKANNSSDKLRHYVLSKINEFKGIQIFHIVLDKTEVRSPYLKDNKNKLYNFVAGKLAKNILMKDADLLVIIDKSKGKKILRIDFDRYFRTKLLEGETAGDCTISHGYSHNFAGLQMVDFLAWSVFRKYEYKDLDFNKNITVEQEVFSVWF
ncbi:DUF3800 domain-containing protein [Candidatus Woesearchaeota archaeon]|nr:DUF3800 domain-containing protein [Candidatus Woesearchaeota archaeon]USN44621.1 MAG: DUF3800 domain-containing protein [Candidatus Woesearchaeota archaeon]